MKILELFGGIGACTQALKRLNIYFEIADYVEIDKYAVASYNAINGTNFKPQDITTWDKDLEVDLIMHGSPCQDISTAGKGAGADEGSGTRSSLMYETLRIVNKLKPKYVVWENVKNLLGKKHKHNFDKYVDIMNEGGYNSYYQVLNAKDYGIPQNRERVYTISIRKDIDNGTFKFPEKEELKLKLKDMLEDEVDERYYLSDKMINYISADNDKWTGNNKEALINKTCASTINTNEGSRRCDASNYISNDVGDNYNLKNIHKTLRETLEQNEIKDGVNYIDAYNRTIDNKGLAKTISTRVDASNNTYLAIKNEPKVLGGIGEKKSNGGTQWYQQDRIYDNNVGLSISTTAVPYYPDNQLRIRKLTPKETWRLMGFNDAEFERAQKVNSNAQLYKQAGNSIVVDVLVKILYNLLLR